MNFSRASVYLLYLILGSSLGPYLVKDFGIRLEHIVVYSLFMILSYKIFVLRGRILKLLLLLLLGSLAPLIGEFFSSFEKNLGQILAGLDNHLLFIACLYGTFVLLRYNNVSVKLLKFYIIILSLNTIIAVSTPIFNLGDILSVFHSTTLSNIDLGVSSVSHSAANMGRFTGIYDQPLEAGLAYSIALLILVYLFKMNILSKGEEYFFIVLIMIGGFISVSKIFIFGGIPLSFLYVVLINRLPLSKVFVFFTPLLPLYLLALSVQDTWASFEFLFRLFSFENFMSNLLFGRFDADSTIIAGAKAAYLDSPLFGMGFSGFSIYDSGYFQLFYQGGFFGLLAHIFVLLYINLAVRSSTAEIKSLILVVSILQVGALLGGPVTLSNRVPVILAMLYAIALSTVNFRGKTPPRINQARRARFRSMQFKSALDKIAP